MFSCRVMAFREAFLSKDCGVATFLLLSRRSTSMRSIRLYEVGILQLRQSCILIESLFSKLDTFALMDT